MLYQYQLCTRMPEYVGKETSCSWPNILHQEELFQANELAMAGKLMLPEVMNGSDQCSLESLTKTNY